jgi:hypothetical protein
MAKRTINATSAAHSLGLNIPADQYSDSHKADRTGFIMSDNDVIKDGEQLMIVESDRHRPWDRLTGESTAAFSAFCQYRDMGAERSLVKVGQQLGKSRALMERWSAAWNWVGRVWEFDVAEAERTREQLSRDRLAMRRRQVRLGIAMQSVASYGLRELQQKVERGERLDLTVDEIVNLMRVGAELERRAVGEEKDSQHTKIIVNFGTYDDEEEYENTLRGKNDAVN